MIFRKINITQENEDARNSQKVRSKLIEECKVRLKKSWIILFVLMLVLVIESVFLRSGQAWVKSTCITVLVLRILHLRTDLIRLRELRSIDPISSNGSTNVAEQDAAPKRASATRAI
jgi:ABC-type siderophore export system fused ATPase/permease subunit